MKKIGDTKKANKMAKIVSCLFVFAILMTAVPVIAAASNANGKTGETADICSACSNRPMPPEGVMAPLASLAPGYCPSSGGSHGYEYILNIVPTINPDRTIIITVNIYIANPSGCTYGNPCPEYDESPEYINAWIDWNGDKTWEPSERVMDEALTGYENINYHGTMTASSMVTIPLDAVETTWMRVNLGWGYDPNDPCEDSWSWGDVNDMEIQLDVVTCKVVEIDALKDIKIRDDDGNDIVDPVYKLDDNGNIVKDEPIADYMKSNSFKIKAAVDAFKGGKRTDKPEWTPTVKYSWCTDDRVSICPTCGGGEFDGWSGEFDVILPQSVGQYDVLIEFTFYKDGEQIGDPQETSHILFVTYDKPKKDWWGRYDVEKPKEIWLETASSWGKGAKNDKDVAKLVLCGEYANTFGWIYTPSKPYMMGNWDIYIKKGGEKEGHCYTWSDIWVAISRVLGIKANYKDYKGDFITKKATALDGQTGNIVPRGSTDKDRWKFISHCVGKYGTFYDPTFNKEHTELRDSVLCDKYDGIGKDGYGKYWKYKNKDSTCECKLYFEKYPYEYECSGSFDSSSTGEFNYESLSSAISKSSITSNFSDYGLDTNNDTLYDYLVGVIEINATKVEDYKIIADLELNESTIISGDTEIGEYYRTVPEIPISLNTGINTITLYFSGRDIYNSGIDGNYTTTIILFDKNGTYIDDKSFNTSFYNYIDFQIMLIELISITDSGKDTNSDGLFDYLTLEVNLNVTKAGNYSVEGMLYNESHITSAFNHSHLNEGVKTVYLDFSGLEIRQHRINGPYTIELVFSDMNYTKTESYNTATYNYTDFQKPKAEFTGTYSDYGTDTDANGVYDYLTTEIEVNVSNPGNYTLLGWLSDSKESDIIWANNHTYLGIGTHSVLLNFDGTAIYKHGIDGPYNLSYLTLHDENDTPIDLVYAAYNTSAYSYTDFQSPSASFRDTYSDYGVDTNGDGFYEYLTVEVGLDITSAGNYSTHGCLYDIYGNETADTYNLTYLNTGNQIVTLNFGGNSIYKHGVNGSFNLTHLLLYDENGTLVDNIYYAYTTSAYSYTDFQPLIRLTGNYLDYGTDTDGNGLFDNLTVDVGVMLASEGHCVATARLMDTNGEEILWASNISWLPANLSQIIQLNFDGKSIYGNMVDGPYYVRDVYVYHTGDPTLSDYVYDAYTTAAYSYTDFELPPMDDIVAFRNGRWWVCKPDHSGTDYSFNYGIPGDIPVVGDVNNDGVDDVVIFRNGKWWVSKQDHTGTDYSFNYGIPGDIPVVGDVNNDGSDDVVIFRNGKWWVSKQDHTGTDYSFNYGIPGDIPVIGDVNNDGSDDVVIFRNGKWWVCKPDHSGTDYSFNYGIPGDIPVIGDVNNDGVDDVVIFRNGKWWVCKPDHTGTDYSFNYGIPGDKPVVGDIG